MSVRLYARGRASRPPQAECKCGKKHEYGWEGRREREERAREGERDLIQKASVIKGKHIILIILFLPHREEGERGRR